MIEKFQNLEGKTKQNNIRSFFDEKNYRRQSGFFQFEEDPYPKNEDGE